METIGFEDHNHAFCASSMIATAEAYCSLNKLQFTPTRRRVLEYLIEERKALGAYYILQRLAKDGLGTQPPVAYRALDFLVRHGFVHKVERLNAFVACAYPHSEHEPAFMICRSCESVAEAVLRPSSSLIGKAAQEAGFRVEKTIVEAEGLCPDCAGSGAA